MSDPLSSRIKAYVPAHDSGIPDLRISTSDLFVWCLDAQSLENEVGAWEACVPANEKLVEDLRAEVERLKAALDDAVGQVADGNFMRGLLPDTDKDVLAEIMASAKEGEKK